MRATLLGVILFDCKLLLPRVECSYSFVSIYRIVTVKTLFFVCSLLLLQGGCSKLAIVNSDGPPSDRPETSQVDDIESKSVFHELSDAVPGTRARVSIQGRSAVSVQVEKHYWSASGKKCIEISESERPVRHALCLAPNGLHNRVTVQRGTR